MEWAAGKLPKHNNVSWRGNSCLNDGKDPGSTFKDLVGGYYDAGDAIKFNFPQSFAMTLLSWSVIEYSAKYEAAGELAHVKELIKWGSDYFLKTFNNSADTINTLVTQVWLWLLSSFVVYPFALHLCFDTGWCRLDRGTLLEEVLLLTITIAGCVPRTLTTRAL